MVTPNTQSTADNTSVGAGQQQPIDSNSDFWWISFLIRQFMADLEIMIPVQVTAVHPGNGSPPAVGTVDVQLLVSLLDGNGNAVQQGIVYGVPYFRLQGGAWAVIIDPAINDYGYILSASRDTSLVETTPGIQNPGSYRKHSFADGIYMGGILNAVPAGYLWLKADGTWSLTDKPGNVIQGDSNGITATPLNGGFFKVNGAIHATGAIIAGFGGGDQVGLQTHTHPANGSPPTPGT